MAQIPYQFLLAIPYLLTVGLSAIFGKRVRPPKAILQAYRRELPNKIIQKKIEDC